MGQVFLLDNQDLQGYWEKGTGSNITGNSMGIEALNEFQVLTNTYSSQFGGTGAAINAASKAGTNDLHGSLYEFVRNSGLDARNLFDGTQIPPFSRNQFGGSLGGPVIKDKLFFFVNYEGLISNLGITGDQFVPDTLSRTGDIPCNAGPPGQTPVNCSNGERIMEAINPAVAPYLNLYPTPPVGAQAECGGGSICRLSKRQRARHNSLDPTRKRELRSWAHGLRSWLKRHFVRAVHLRHRVLQTACTLFESAGLAGGRSRRRSIFCPRRETHHLARFDQSGPFQFLAHQRTRRSGIHFRIRPLIRCSFTSRTALPRPVTHRDSAKTVTSSSQAALRTSALAQRHVFI